MRRGWWALATGLLLLGPGCARHKTGGPEPLAAPVRIEVKNEYALPVEIFAVGAGTRYRVGTVNPGLSSTFTISHAVLGNGAVEFEAHPNDGSPVARSGPLLLSPGAVVDFRVAAVLFNSSATIRPER